MKDYQREFIRFTLDSGALRFGKFTLKSGRISPYFFNAGQFQTGEELAAMGQFYAAALLDSSTHGDVLFGPAYKGIPLVCATAIALSKQHNKNLPWCFNRKEAKDHGEGGLFVGADPAGKQVILIDDVITAGTATRHAYDILTAVDAKISGILVALDRQERGLGDVSAIQEIRANLKIPVRAIITLSDIEAYLAEQQQTDQIQAIRAYREQYGT